MNQIYAGGHSIAIKGDKLIIDGKVADVKLKRSLFGGFGGWTTMQNVTINQSGVRGTIKMGRNTIVINGNKITVNGEEVRFGEEKPVNRQSLDEQLNKGASKYLISTAKEDEIEIDGEICRRIIAKEDIVDRKGTVLVKKGQKGGYVAGRYNLSEDGTCWIYDDAVVRQDAEVRGNAQVSDKADIYGNATIGGSSQVSEQATVHGNVSAGGNVRISGSADVHGNVSLGGNVCVSGNADVHGNVSIGGNVEISGNADVHGNISLGRNVKISGNADLHGNVVLSGDEVITNNLQLKDLVGNDDGSGVSIKGIVIGDIVNGRVISYDSRTRKSNDDSLGK